MAGSRSNVTARQELFSLREDGRVKTIRVTLTKVIARAFGGLHS
jgi:hypothetical protein